MSHPDQNLANLGITLPTPAKPVANYVGWAQTGSLVFTAGQLPLVEGKVTTVGICGQTVSKEDAKLAARHAAINILAQVKDACGWRSWPGQAHRQAGRLCCKYTTIHGPTFCGERCI